MDTHAFFDLTLPQHGLRCIAVPNDNGGFRHFFVADNAKAATLAQHLDAQGRNVFFALAGFTKQALDRERNERGRLIRGGRKQANVGWLKSFWADLDCGEGKPYATARDALVALKAFLDLTGLAKPWIVASGRGLHIYWPLEAEVDRTSWKPVAEALKQAFSIAGLKADPARTSDEASVLRPVGCHHRKADAIPVRLLKSGEVWSFEAFRDQVQAFLDANPEALAPTKKSSGGLNAALGCDVEYPPADADRIADQCAVLGLMRDTRGNVDQPTWYRSLGVIAFCEDGDRIAQEWSDGHPDYDPDEVAEKLEQVRQFKPTTCAKLAECQPDLCAGCPHNGKLVSPIRLGMTATEVPITPQAAPPSLPHMGLVAQPPASQPAQITLPPGYRYATLNGKSYLQVYVPTGDGGGHWISFFEGLFFPVNRLNTDDGYAMEIELWARVDASGRPLPDHVRRFPLPNYIIAEGGKGLAAALGRQEIVPLSPRQKPEMEAYLQAWMAKLRNEADEVRQLQHFGWHNEKFLVGNTLIEPTGNVRPVLLKGVAAHIAPAFAPKGSLSVWQDAIHRAYHHKGQEHFQFIVMLGFAAPLFGLFNTVSGVTVYAYSEGSGVGKTTAQRAALSVWGNWQDLQLSDEKVTSNMLWGYMGAYHNLPILYDELTNMANGDASRLVFSASSGRQKQRMAPDGSVRTNNSNWSTILMASGNNLLSEKVSLFRANAESELVRTFEFTCPNNSPLTVNEAAEIFPLLAENYGHAGIAFARYIVPRKAKIQELLQQMLKKVNTEANISQNERYWAALIASVLTATIICNRIRLIHFDLPTLKAWIYDRLMENRQQRNDNVSHPLEQFGRMLADLWQGILVTQGEGNLSQNKFAVVLQDVSPRGQLTGRAILPTDEEKRYRKPPVLLLSVASVKEWANRHKASAREIFAALVKEGWALPTPVKFSLGKGTMQFSAVSSQITCWSIDLSKVIANSGHSGVKERLAVINGNGSVGQIDEDADSYERAASGY